MNNEHPDYTFEELVRTLADMTGASVSGLGHYTDTELRLGRSGVVRLLETIAELKAIQDLDSL